MKIAVVGTGYVGLPNAKLGWQPKVNLEDGLKETIAYFGKVFL